VGGGEICGLKVDGGWRTSSYRMPQQAWRHISDTATTVCGCPMHPLQVAGVLVGDWHTKHSALALHGSARAGSIAVDVQCMRQRCCCLGLANQYLLCTVSPQTTAASLLLLVMLQMRQASLTMKLLASSRRTAGGVSVCCFKVCKACGGSATSTVLLPLMPAAARSRVRAWLWSLGVAVLLSLCHRQGMAPLLVRYCAGSS
jgi:hypothetical protein